MSTENGKKWDSVYDTIEGMWGYDEELLCLPCMTEEIMDDLMNKFEFQEDDVLIVSYPQSGFFWLQETLYHLFNQSDVKIKMEDKKQLAFRIPFLEHEFRNNEPLELLTKYKRPRLMKTHLHYKYLEKQMAKYKDKIKIILWINDPKTTITAYHNFWLKFGTYFGFPHLDWDQFFDLFKAKQLFEGDWYDTNLSWVNEFEGKDNFLVLNYQDAKQDVMGTAKEMADFCGVTINTFGLTRVAYFFDYDKVPDYKEKYSKEQEQYVDRLSKEKLAGTILEEKYT